MSGVISKIKNEIGKPSSLTIGKLKKQTESIKVEIDIVGHCNLNCKGCSHFSPIVKNEFLDLFEFEKEVKRLSEVLGNNLGILELLGGEPLLHPQLKEFLKLSRQYLKQQKIILTTNGILLLKQSEEFWEVCKNENVELQITRYPINFDYKAAKRKAKNNGLICYYYGRTKIMEKSLYSLPLRADGNCNPINSFNKCFMAGNCITLKNGRLYTCSYAAHIDRFNSYYNSNFEICKDDYIDIFDDISETEIIKKLKSPIPFCRYCDIDTRRYGEKWETSKKDITEWCIPEDIKDVCEHK